MKVELKKRKKDVAEPPVLKLEVTEEETGTWVLSAAYYFTSDYTHAIKTFADNDGYFAEQVPFHAWENVKSDVIQIVSEEVEEEMKAAAEIGTYVDLVFQFEANDESLYYMAETIAEEIQRKYPDLFQ
ncbi:MAG: hypothetical protein QXT28_06225 [Thermofilaceae archaeon]